MVDRFETRWHGIGTGGSVALDFANTLDWRLRERPVELVHTVTDLLRFGWSAEVITLGEAKALRRWSESHPRKAAHALAGALELREAIATIAQARVRPSESSRSASAVPAAALATLESAHHAALRARSLRADGPSVAWVWRNPTPEIERIAWGIALDAARLLTSSEGDRIRQCADAECGWFFLDVSRNRSRRWCSMEGCGNRNKVRSFYQRSTATARREQPGRKGS